MESLGHTGYSFSKELNTSEAVISNIRKEKNPPNVQIIERLLNKYEEVNPEWLLSGRGHMLRGRPNEMFAENTEALLILRQLDARVKKLDGLMQRSIKNQLERSIMMDEVVNDLQQQLIQLERNVKKVMKVPHKTG